MASAKETTTAPPAVDPANDETVITTDVAVVDEETQALSPGVDVGSIIASMNDATKVVTTIQGEDFEARLALAAALTTSEPVADHLGETIALVDYVITEAQFVDDKTGDIVTAPRIVLVADDGKAFHGVSVGMLTSLRNIKLAIGELWGQKPVPVKVVRQKGNNGYHFHTINIVR